uniref:Uncharacterized protein n=1 Tax=Panagrolaimus sp. ES5 TaxID=591445 RepID=A0AC34FCX0_9BILA
MDTSLPFDNISPPSQQQQFPETSQQFTPIHEHYYPSPGESDTPDSQYLQPPPQTPNLGSFVASTQKTTSAKTAQSRKKVADTPTTPKISTRKQIRPPQQQKKSVNDKLVDDIVEHIMANRDIYPVTSNEKILNKDERVIPVSDLKKSVTRYLDAKPGEKTPPGTNRIASVLKADPQICCPTIVNLYQKVDEIEHFLDHNEAIATRDPNLIVSYLIKHLPKITVCSVYPLKAYYMCIHGLFCINNLCEIEKILTF